MATKKKTVKGLAGRKRPKAVKVKAHTRRKPHFLNDDVGGCSTPGVSGLSGRKRKVGRPKKKGKATAKRSGKKRKTAKVSAWITFMRAQMRAGKTMKQAGALWRKKKK